MKLGVKLVNVRTITQKEVEQEGWEHDYHASYAKVLEFDDGSVIYGSQDYEGNGSGAIFGYKKVKGKSEHFAF